MSILTRPRPPRLDDPPDPEAPEALIEEARRRARRRRRGYAACTLVAAAGGLLAFYGFNGGVASPSQVHAGGPAAGAAAAAPGDATAWQSAPGLAGGAITAIGVDPQDPSMVFAATLEAGVFKSANGGRTWRPLDLAPGVSRVDALAIAPGDPKTLYVGTGRGVFKTTNGGASWQATSSDLLANETAERRQHRRIEGYVYTLAVDRHDPDTVYAATWEKGVFKTTDGGASWRSIGLRAVSPLVLDPRDPETIYAGAVGAATGPTSILHASGVFKSSDGGASWHPVGLRGTNVAALALDPQHPKTVYAGTDGKGVVKSTDGGRTWRHAGFEGEDVGGLILNPKNPENVYAESKGEIFASTNGGGTWRALNAGWVSGTWPTALALNPRNPATIYVGTITAVDGKGDVGAGIFKSVDAGDSWRPVNAGLTDARASARARSSRPRDGLCGHRRSRGVQEEPGRQLASRQHGPEEPRCTRVGGRPARPRDRVRGFGPRRSSRALTRAPTGGGLWARLMPSRLRSTRTTRTLSTRSRPATTCITTAEWRRFTRVAPSRARTGAPPGQRAGKCSAWKYRRPPVRFPSKTFSALGWLSTRSTRTPSTPAPSASSRAQTAARPGGG